MSKRYSRLLGGATAAATVLMLGSFAPALADPAATPSPTDYVGVGSDTTQFMMTDLINGKTVNGSHVQGYNEQHTGSPQLASFDACTYAAGTTYPCTPSSSTSPEYIDLNTNSANADTHIIRPNGSGAGKGLLYGSANNNEITFARSSSGLSSTEVSAGLQAYPYAVDTLVLVTSGNVPSNAPATLTNDQIVGIYNGTYTNWSQVGGKPGTIAPEVPQAGSGTRSFFEAQLKGLNGGTAVTYGTDVNQTVQEHDPTTIQNDPNVIAPFSLGRANLAGTVNVENGFRAQRALYNVLRSSTSTDANGVATPASWVAGTPEMNAIFGPDGFLCSAAARPLIEADGFKQLHSTADGGDCGVAPSNGVESNLAVYDATGNSSQTAVSFTPVSGKFGQPGTATVAVSGAGGQPTGQVTLSVGNYTKSAQLSGGAATFNLPGTIPAGVQPVSVSYAGDNNFTASNDSDTYSVSKSASSTKVAHPGTVLARHRANITVTSVLVPASSVKPTGTVKITEGRRVLITRSLSGGVAKMTLPALKRGKHVLVARYLGNGNATGSTATFTIVQK